MRHITRFVGLALAASTLSGANLHAQKTGTLLRTAEPTVGPSNEEARKEFERKDRERKERFAVLVADPSLSSTVRSSAWTVSLTAFQQGQEAKLQANVCDVLKKCKETAIDLTLIAPIDKADDFTDVSNLSGLAGSARLEFGGTLSLAAEGEKFGVNGLSFRAALGRPSFDYRATTDLSEVTVRQTIYSLAAAVPLYKSTRIISSVGYRYDNAYKAASPQNVCIAAPFGPAGTQTCDDLVVGGPKHVQTHAAQFEYRRSFHVAAAALTITRDFANEVTGFDIPVWVIPNQSGGLGGGVRFGYRTDTKRVTAALFVSEFKL